MDDINKEINHIPGARSMKQVELMHPHWILYKKRHAYIYKTYINDHFTIFATDWKQITQGSPLVQWKHFKQGPDYL